MGKPKRRFVAKGVPGGYRIWNKKAQKYWGETYDFFPEDLLNELNNQKRPEKLLELKRKAQKLKR